MNRNKLLLKEKRIGKKAVCAVLSTAVLSIQIWEYGAVMADEGTAEFEGTTQVSASEVQIPFATSASELVVETVYIQSGTYVEEGGQILKLTEESYQEAMDYYEAAVLYAENNLTNVQLAYDKGMQEAEYTLQLAQAEAGQAEFERDQSLQELSDTIEEHEEILPELEEAIEEYEAGIADGSFASSSSASGSSSSSSSGSSSGKSQSSDGDSEEEQKESKSEQEEEKESQSETESEKQTQDGTDTKDSEEDAQLQALNAAIVGQKAAVEELTASRDALAEEIESKNEEYDAVLKKIYQLADLDTMDFCGTGSFIVGTSQSSETDVSDDSETESSDTSGDSQTETSVSSQTESSEETEDDTSSGSQTVISGTTDMVLLTYRDSVNRTTSKGIQTAAVSVKAQMPGQKSGMQRMAASGKQNDSFAVIRLSAEASEEIIATEIEEVETEEPETEVQAETELQAAAEEAQAIQEMEAEADEAILDNSAADAQETGETNAAAEEDTASEGEETEDASGTQAETEDTDITDDETKLETEEQSDTLEKLLARLNAMEEPRKDLYSQYDEVNESLKAALAKLKELEAQKEELEKSLNTVLPLETEEQEESTGSGLENGSGDEKSGSGDAQDESGDTQGGSSDAQGGSSDTQNGSGSSGWQSSTQSGSQSESTKTMGNEASGSSGSGGSGSTDTASGGSSAGSSSGQGTAGGSGIMNSDANSSLFGNTYDLTEVKSLLERIPEDEDEAEEILEQLQESLEEVEEQYAQLLRIEEVTRLEIEYNYDTAVIAGKLAEITYRQQVQELEETLQTAQEELAELEQEKETLGALTDGVVTAEQAGNVAAVNYEEGDVLDSMTALYSIYDLETVSVSIEVSQYEICGFSVGDTVNVEISGYGNYEGTVAQKAVEAEEGTSRTTVNYEVEICIDNSSGRLGSGLSAVVTEKEETADE